MKILITGASGFIGSWVCRKSLANNVIAVVSPFSKTKRLDDVSKKIKIVKANLSDPSVVKKIFKKYKPEVVMHLATHGVYQYQQKDEKRIVQDNFVMTANLLEESVNSGVKKFINTGSVFEYGSQNKKVKESNVSLKDILNKYSAIKMATTALANSYKDKISVITLRPFTAYGPGEDETRFIRSTIEKALNNDEIKIVKGVVRDFVYVEDLADAFVKAAKINFDSGDIVNIAGGEKYTLEDVAAKIIEITKSKSKIKFDQKYKRARESMCWADISRAKKVLGWKPDNSINSGLIKTIDSFKK